MMVVVFSHSVMPNSLRPHSLLHARLPCLSPTPRAYSNSCPLSLLCHPTISSSVVPFFFRLQSFPASVFSDELALCIRWPKYWSFSLSISLSRISWLSAVLGVLWPVAASFQWLPLPSRGCLPSLSVSWSKVSSSYENSSCIRFRVPSNPVGPHFFIKIFFNVDNYFKSLLNLLQYFFCCLCPGFGCEAVGSSRPSQGWNPQPRTGRRSLNDWTTMEVPSMASA